ncbi:MAG TPA: hypothetical protein VMG12_42310 [Polyangiaceae bacterium]|nr:hypothetical protein [Polyangiaceae bacterium]
MTWRPIERQALDALLDDGLEHADDAVADAWAAMRIEPRKWQCSPWGDAGGGFWAVAVREHVVVWYNDIEHGFNTSPFEHEGVIGEYWCNQGDFGDYLATLPEARAARSEQEHETGEPLPAALRVPGRIERRQTTSWTLQLEAGGAWRVHFRPAVEVHFATSEFAQAELAASHPVLAEHREPWLELYFDGKPSDAGALELAVASAVERASDGWRGLERYRNPSAPLADGYGLLLRAPQSVTLAVRGELERAGLACSLVESREPRAGSQALLLGRSFIVADAFRFEALP